MLAMDYRLTDYYSDPPGTTDTNYTEQLVGYRGRFSAIAFSRCSARGAIAREGTRLRTFGSFTTSPKITPDVLATWAELRGVPRSAAGVFGRHGASLRGYLTESFASRESIRSARTLQCRPPA